MNAIRSKRYLDGSRGATCKLRIAHVCTGDTATVVPAHLRDIHTGRGIKASDLSVVDACYACHAVMDGQAGWVLPKADWYFYALRGLQETLEARVEAGLLIVVGMKVPATPTASTATAAILITAVTGQRWGVTFDGFDSEQEALDFGYAAERYFALVKELTEATARLRKELIEAHDNATAELVVNQNSEAVIADLLARVKELAEALEAARRLLVKEGYLPKGLVEIDAALARSRAEGI